MSPMVETLQEALGGRYIVRHELGQGATARVYLADDLKHGRQVAIKVLRPELAQAVGSERFLREIRIGARLQHPHILPLYDSGDADGVPFCVMPYVTGETLRSRLRREPQLPVPIAVTIARDVADALAFAHGQGVIHRDIKPENILLSGNRAVVADFGIARAIAIAGEDRLTGSGLAIGTPAYMSPEQGGCADTIDGRSDIYSLGCVLYEMLAGEPPFAGRTAQALILRHMHDRPSSLEVLRPTAPAHVSQAIETALAKVPADRFASALEFAHALDAPTGHVAGPARPRRAAKWRQLALAAGVIATVAVGAWRVIRRPAITLDPHRVVVFPLRDGASGLADAGAGEDVATYIGHVLDGTEPLKWEEGRDIPSSSQGAQRLSSLSPDEMARLARSRTAAYYIDGSILREGDSVTVIVRLYDVTGDSLVSRAGRSGPASASAARLGALATGDLLPALLEPGRKVDVGALRERSPAAIASFLQGEHSYRAMQFEDALVQYRRAVQDDSLFALAAVRGAEAARWLNRWEDAEELTAIAVRRIAMVTPRYAEFIRGWSAYVSGNGDSASDHLRQAVRIDPDWTEGWMGLGEVYYHLLPEESPLDSLAEASFERARRLDPDFFPAQYHLAELAILRGDIPRARRLVAEVQKAAKGGAASPELMLMLQCGEGRMSADEWRSAAPSGHATVMNAANVLAASPTLRGCAEGAFRGVLADDSAADSYRFSALVGLHYLLVTQERYGEVRELVASPDGRRLHQDWLFLLDAVTGVGFEREAADLASAQGSEYEPMPSTLLWLRGIWHAHRGPITEAKKIAALLATRADSSAESRDSLFAHIVAAHAALGSGDTTLARERFEDLVPRAKADELAWSLWAPLGLEKLVLAKILFLQGDYDGVLRVASIFDSSVPISYVLGVPQSLDLRLRAADALGRRELVARFRARLAALAEGGVKSRLDDPVTLN